MGKANAALLAFNRGMVSPLALARVDLEKMRFFAEEQSDWLPRVLGAMLLRPGLEYVRATPGNARTWSVPFVYALSDQAVLEFAPNKLRVVIDDLPITRPLVSTTITNGNFDNNLTGWTDADEVGATSQWVTGGFMGLVGTETSAAVRTQATSIASGDVGKEHALRVVVSSGEVRLRVGSSSGAEDWLGETVLGAGEHSLAFIPTATTAHVSVSALTRYQSLVSSVAIENPGEMALTTPWAEDDLPLLRTDQSADVVFLACKGKAPYRIERRATRSWSLVRYLPTDGPWLPQNLTNTTIAASALSGDVTLTSSRPLFRVTHIDALFKLVSDGQTVSESFTADGVTSSNIRVTGVGSDRAVTLTISNTWAGKVSLERSIGDDVSFTTFAYPYGGTSEFIDNRTQTFNDGLDNQIVYYRLAVKPGDYTSGVIDAKLSYPRGSITGVARVTGYTSSTQVTAQVIKDFGGTDPVTDWTEGQWSPRRGWPTSLVLHEARLWFAGQDKIFGSVTDDYSSFDDSVEGDSGPISRSLGSGAVATVNWLASGQRLLIGTDTAEKVVRSNSLDEPLSPTAFSIKTPSTYGCSPVAPVFVDTSVFFVSGNKLCEMRFEGGVTDYVTSDVTVLVPEIGGSAIVKLAVQRKPDTRIYCLRADGTLSLLVFDKAEEIRCWTQAKTAGFIEDIYVRPARVGEIEDRVYCTVRRTIGGLTVRWQEKFALEAECVGGPINKMADGGTVYNGPATSTINGLERYNGAQVIVWADGRDLSPDLPDGTQKTYTVTSGQLSLPGELVSEAFIGLPYEARFKSSKLAYAVEGGNPLAQPKRVNYLGLILRNAHARALRYGHDFDHLDPMPLVEDGTVVDENTIWENYDKEAFEFDGDYNTDSRLCLVARAPRPVTVLACALVVEAHAKL